MPLPPLPPSPGPGHYETHKTPEPSHGGQQLGGAMFRSTTSRWVNSRYVTSEGPGPGVCGVRVCVRCVWSEGVGGEDL